MKNTIDKRYHSNSRKSGRSRREKDFFFKLLTLCFTNNNIVSPPEHDVMVRERYVTTKSSFRRLVRKKIKPLPKKRYLSVHEKMFPIRWKSRSWKISKETWTFQTTRLIQKWRRKDTEVEDRFGDFELEVDAFIRDGKWNEYIMSTRNTSAHLNVLKKLARWIFSSDWFTSKFERIITPHPFTQNSNRNEQRSLSFLMYSTSTDEYSVNN